MKYNTKEADKENGLSTDALGNEFIDESNYVLKLLWPVKFWQRPYKGFIEYKRRRENLKP